MSWADFDALVLGASAAATVQVDEALVARTAALTGDDNPIHVDAVAARRFGQSRPVAHGVILLGAISKLIGTELPGPGSIWFQNEVEFIAPIYVGDVVTVTVSVARLSHATRIVVLDVDARNADGTVVARGKATVRVPAAIQDEDTPMQVQERVALVTGATGGIGGEIAGALAGSGMRVLVGYHSDATAAAACVARIRACGGAAESAAANLAAGGAADLVTAAMLAFGRVDAVIHAATPPITYAPFLETPPEVFRNYFESYVNSLAELARLTAPGMKERHHGRIVTILSSALSEVPPKLSAYVTAKHAALGLCRALAVEFGPWNITVNAVSPSMVVGRHTDAVGSAAREIMARKTPLRRLAEASDVAAAVRFLVGPEGGFVSGANIPVTGGILFG
jgi:3-oxoacyl-[acyl-carrier protein] reductase